MPRRHAAATTTSTCSVVLVPADTNTRKRGPSDSDRSAVPGGPREAKKAKSDREEERKKDRNRDRGMEKEKEKKRRKRRRKSSVTGTASHVAAAQERGSTTGPSALFDSDVLLLTPEKVQPVAEEEIDSVMMATRDKGKGKVKKDDDKLLSPSAGAEQHVLEIARLKEELEVNSALLKRHQDHLTEVQQSLTCDICLDLLDRPFAISPCGHAGCHKCLTLWFKAGVNDDDEDNEDNDELGQRRKRCPVCRALVLNRPIEMWGMKSIVKSIKKSGLTDLPLAKVAPDDSTPTEAPDNINSANADPWRNIFRPLRREVRLSMGERASEVGEDEERSDEGEDADLGWYDPEDGIYRCQDCYHEIWGRSCSHCGRVYFGHESEDESEDDEDSIMGDEEGYNEDEFDEGIGEAIWAGVGMQEELGLEAEVHVEDDWAAGQDDDDHDEQTTNIEEISEAYSEDGEWASGGERDVIEVDYSSPGGERVIEIFISDDENCTEHEDDERDYF